MNFPNGMWFTHRRLRAKWNSFIVLSIYHWLRYRSYNLSWILVSIETNASIVRVWDVQIGVSDHRVCARFIWYAFDDNQQMASKSSTLFCFVLVHTTSHHKYIMAWVLFDDIIFFFRISCCLALIHIHDCVLFLCLLRPSSEIGAIKNELKWIIYMKMVWIAFRFISPANAVHIEFHVRMF